MFFLGYSEFSTRCACHHQRRTLGYVLTASPLEPPFKRSSVSRSSKFQANSSNADEIALKWAKPKSQAPEKQSTQARWCPHGVDPVYIDTRKVCRSSIASRPSFNPPPLIALLCLPAIYGHILRPPFPSTL